YEQAVAIDGNALARGHLERIRSGVRAGRTAAGSGTPSRTARTGASIGPPIAQPHMISRDMKPIVFRNSAGPAGLNFVLRNSASTRKYQVETMPGGVAVLDYNNDGWLDIYFVNGAELPSMKKSLSQYWNRLFRNNRNGTFT